MHEIDTSDEYEPDLSANNQWTWSVGGFLVAVALWSFLAGAPGAGTIQPSNVQVSGNPSYNVLNTIPGTDLRSTIQSGGTSRANIFEHASVGPSL